MKGLIRSSMPYIYPNGLLGWVCHMSFKYIYNSSSKQWHENKLSTMTILQNNGHIASLGEFKDIGVRYNEQPYMQFLQS